MHTPGLEGKHTHTAADTTLVGNGVAYEVCSCGASRRTVQGKGGWHACKLCVFTSVSTAHATGKETP